MAKVTLVLSDTFGGEFDGSVNLEIEYDPPIAVPQPTTPEETDKFMAALTAAQRHALSCWGYLTQTAGVIGEPEFDIIYPDAPEGQ